MAGRRPVVVIAALEQEVGALVNRMPRSDTVGPQLVIWEADGMVVIVGGVGKVASALATQFACDVFKPRVVLTVGLAGALEKKTKPGQVIVVSGAVQHDVDGRPLTDARGVIPGLGFSAITANSGIADTLLRAARYKSEDARAGVVLTGDQIVTSRAVR